MHPRSFVNLRPRQESVGDEIPQQRSGSFLFTVSTFIHLIANCVFGAFGLRLNAGFWNRTAITLAVDPEVVAPLAPLKTDIGLSSSCGSQPFEEWRHANASHWSCPFQYSSSKKMVYPCFAIWDSSLADHFVPVLACPSNSASSFTFRNSEYFSSTCSICTHR